MPKTSDPTIVFRILISVLGGIAGAVLGRWLRGSGLLAGPNLGLYLWLLGLLIFYLLGAVPARLLGRAWQKLIDRLLGIAAETWLAAIAGTTVALLLTVLLDNVLSSVPGYTWYWSLLIALVLVLGVTALFVSQKQLFTGRRGATSPSGFRSTGADGLLLDTSAIIDGRLVDIFRANFLSGPVLVPRFVLRELQLIADDPDSARRRRGRRGLDVLSRLSELPGLHLEVLDADPGEAQVDDKLVSLARSLPAGLMTTDHNLEQVARVQGVRVLNPNQLAVAVRKAFMPGDRLQALITGEGREEGQGVAYLDDGTMIVIEEAAALKGSEAAVVVTSSLQTNVGRMIFARLEDGTESGNGR